MLRALSVFLLLAACTPGIDQLSALECFPADLSSLFLSTKNGIRDSIAVDPSGETVFERFQPPSGFQRVAYTPGTFGHYLRHFPLQAHGHKVLLFDGREKYRQDVHAAVLAMDVGKRDLQQCADAVMRLRAEYLWKEGKYQDIHFNFTNGFSAPYSRWRAGERIRISGNEVNWVARTGASESYSTFRNYLNMVFAFAGTISLARDLSARSINAIEAGDVFIQSGSPGHAVIVADKAVHPETGEIMVLLAQSYMPAQEIHILKNFNEPVSSPWYSVRAFEELVNTPEWRFKQSDLKRF